MTQDQDNEHDPIAELARVMRDMRRSEKTTNAHVRAALIEAIARGADERQIGRIANHVGLRNASD